jgi:hypothetical protein
MVIGCMDQLLIYVEAVIRYTLDRLHTGILKLKYFFDLPRSFLGRGGCV